MKRLQYLIFLITIFCIANSFASDVKEKLGIGFIVNSQRLFGDTRNGEFIYGINPFILRYNIKPYAFLESDFGFTRLSARIDGFSRRTEMINIGLKLGYRLFHSHEFNPLIYVGAGTFNFQVESQSRNWGGYGALGIGIEWFLDYYVGLNLTTDIRYTTGDDFDGGNKVGRKDSFVNIGIGVNFYMNRRTKYLPKPEFVESIPEKEMLYEEVTDENENLEQNHNDSKSANGLRELSETMQSLAVESNHPSRNGHSVNGMDIKPLPVKKEKEYYTVQPGDFLSKIALQYYGQAKRYRTIFEANREQIKKPDSIYPGQILYVPFINRESLQYSIRPDDWLSKIAFKFYGRVNLYMEIYKANRKKIAEPDQIYVGQVLLIPYIPQ